MQLFDVQTARPKSQPPSSSRPKPIAQNVIHGDSPGGTSGHSEASSGSPSAAIYSTVNKKSPRKHFHITSYVTRFCLLTHFKNLAGNFWKICWSKGMARSHLNFRNFLKQSTHVMEILRNGLFYREYCILNFGSEVVAMMICMLREVFLYMQRLTDEEFKSYIRPYD